VVKLGRINDDVETRVCNGHNVQSGSDGFSRSIIKSEHHWRRRREESEALSPRPSIVSFSMPEDRLLDEVNETIVE